MTLHKYVLRKQRLDYSENAVFRHLNINSLRNKSDSISELIKGKADIFLINNTKLDESFPSNQFVMSDYKFIKKEKKLGSGIAFYIHDQLPNQTIKIEHPLDIAILSIVITIR